MATQPKFTASSDPTGLGVIDPIETRHFTVGTDSPVDPSEVEPDRFAFPVATACRIRATRISLSYMVPIDVRTPEGDHLASIDLPTTREFSGGEYLLELHSPIKTYLRTTGPLTIDATDDGIEIAFDGERAVEVGARSYHSAPAATITVPDDPVATMEAVTAFASALKTTSPERSWPTLRGHPPEVERGDELVIPDELNAPDTGITIAVPPEYGYVYTVAPLAYYLGAEVVPGETAHLAAESGVDRRLGDDVAAVGESVEAVLKRVFLLDCVTRTEGLYPDDLHERDVLETETDLDFESLYGASPADRLAAYLAVSAEAIAAIDSPWHRVTHIEGDPGPEAVELLPYVVNDLSLIAVKDASDEEWSPTETQQQTGDALEEFVRSPGLRRSPGRNSGLEDTDCERETADEPARHAARGVPGVGGYMPLPETDALEQAWIGDRTPVQGTKLLRDAFGRDAASSDDGIVEIRVVCNDDAMREELDATTEIYRDRDDLRVNLSCEFDVTTDELRALLAEESAMFHFIGHIDGPGFECSDGVLDAETLDEANAKIVLLNGCRSHDQGVELVETGARAAVVSLGDLWNEGAVEVGETLARLLHYGFSVGHAMRLVREHTSLGRDYVVVGDPGIAFAQCKSNLPTLFSLSQSSAGGSNRLSITPSSYVKRDFGVGSTIRPHLPSIEKHYVALGESEGVEISRASLTETFENDYAPFIMDGELVWSDEWTERR
ncbi:hypothetical protein [Halorussus caseinilyticus]|uniref:CHAT domain-containing protein n=1 Tax=Halorussus caseinilyticus TaxID=3034025 RepID=A0ABD5WH92_9EURY|nr:hypothetical protein [Halorussus sp. DT72]